MLALLLVSSLASAQGSCEALDARLAPSARQILCRSGLPPSELSSLARFLSATQPPAQPRGPIDEAKSRAVDLLSRAQGRVDARTQALLKRLVDTAAQAVDWVGLEDDSRALEALVKGRLRVAYDPGLSAPGTYDPRHRLVTLRADAAASETQLAGVLLHELGHAYDRRRGSYAGLVDELAATFMQYRFYADAGVKSDQAAMFKSDGPAFLAGEALKFYRSGDVLRQTPEQQKDALARNAVRFDLDTRLARERSAQASERLDKDLRARDAAWRKLRG